jgi:DtxR family Mn-dependent transcriptional regulator
VRVAEDAENDLELMAYIEQRNMKPGVEVELIEREPFEGPLLVQVGGQQVAIGATVADAIFVE